MAPPVDPTVLRRNPNLDVLYKDLCARKLNPNGSTRDTRKQRVHDEVRRNLTTARTNVLSSQILVTSLSDLPSKASAVPPEVHSILEIVTAQLSGHVPDTDREILSGDIDLFLENIATISSALSTQLCAVVDLLRQIANPAKPPSPSELVAQASTLQTSAQQDLPNDLFEAHTDLTNTASALLSTHRHLLTTSIRILEQTQHGALARHTKASAEHIHARSMLLGLQAKAHSLSHPPPPEFVAALKEFKKQQGSGEKALRDREALARRELELYEKAGERGMRDLARRKGVLVGEIERLEREVEKLEGGG